MQLFELPLVATEENWRLFMLRKLDPAFQAYQKNIFQRDDYTCLFCGFRSQIYMEVVNLDSRYTNNKYSNMATACPLCAQCFFLEAVGGREYGGGTIIFYPEMNQGDLNALSHMLFSAIALNLSYITEAKNVYRDLKLRGQMVEKEMGEGMSNPALYGQLMVDARIED